MGSQEVYQFGPFQIDVNERTCRRGEEAIPLTGKAFDLLLLLVRDPGRTITKTDLMAALWPDTVVEEKNLTQTIFLLRKALGDDSESATFIQTLPRLGYKFVAPVYRHQHESQASASAIPTKLDARQIKQEGSLAEDPERSLQNGASVSGLLKRAPAAIPAQRAFLSWDLPWGAAAVLLLVSVSLGVIHFRERLPAIPEPTRFQIFPPEHTRFGQYVALSPDGQRLVFDAVGADGVRHLWIRALDSIESRLLPGTENATSPFWSPDNRSIAFVIAGKLKKMDTFGAAASQTIVEGRDGIGLGSWNQDGIILFGGGGNGGVLRSVVATGGTPNQVTALDSSRQEPGNSFPSFLPDGRRFVYFRNSPVSANRGIYVGSLDAKPLEQDRRRLLESDSNATYSPSADSARGVLLFMRKSSLMAQRFDVGRLKLTGEPVLVAEQVGASKNVYKSFSASATTLAYRADTQETTDRLTWLDRQGRVIDQVGDPGSFRQLALSPDGTRVAVVGIATDGTRDIRLLEFVRGVNSRLTFGPADQYPVWSPDGSRIAFEKLQETGDLYERTSNGAGGDRLLISSAERKVPTDWSSDGHYLLLRSGNTQTRGDIWILPIGAESKPFRWLGTEFEENEGRFSPDMRWIAYTSNESGRAEVYVRPFAPPSTGASSSLHGDVSRKWTVSKRGGSQPHWRGDGKELFYMAPDNTIMTVEVNASAAFHFGAPKPLFKSLSDIWDVRADGKRFLVSVHTAESAPAPITVVLNWQASLKK